MTTSTISVIVPVLDEQAGIRQCLMRLLAQSELGDIIVVDGGSTDDTVALARHFPVRVVAGPRGRGPQQDLGATYARGDVLLFVHADVLLPDNAARTVRQILADPDVVAGAFRTWTIPDQQISGLGFERSRRPSLRVPLGPLLHLADLRSRYSRLPYGDQALFVRAEIFRAAGGFGSAPLMEDLALARRLWRFGPIRIARQRVRVSGRRFESAPCKQTLWVNTFPFLHAVGVPTKVLARLYGNPR